MTNTQNDPKRSPISMDEEFAAVAAALTRSTVQVKGRRFGSGSGVIWTPDGLIITNAHVARSSHATVELWDGRILEAVVTAKDNSRDLATLKVEATDLPSANIGNSDALRVGELVLAVGNPFHLIGALTTGIIHSLGSGDTSSRQRWVMADIHLAPGNSGGPLADAQGRVIGINSMIVGGLGFAVPSNAVERFLQRSEARPPYLGVTIQPVVVTLGYGRVLGLLVLEVQSHSLAQQAGFLIGDVLIGVNGQLLRTPHDLIETLSDAGSEELLSLDILRGGTRISRSVIMGSKSEVEAA